MFPFVLLLLAYFQRRRISRRDVLAAAPFFGVSLLLGLVTIYFQYQRSISDILVRNDSMPSRAATAGCAVWFYLGKAILPVNLMFNYPRWEVTAFGAAAFLPLGAAVCALGVLWRVKRSGAIALAGYALMLMPMLGFLNIFYMRYALVSDHYQYHAIPFVLVAVVSRGGGCLWACAARREEGDPGGGRGDFGGACGGECFDCGDLSNTGVGLAGYAGAESAVVAGACAVGGDVRGGGEEGPNAPGRGD